MNLQRRQEAMPSKLKIAEFKQWTFQEFVKHFLELYDKVILKFNCGLTFVVLDS